MPAENKTEMFMRLLGDALEVDRSTRNENMKRQNKARASRFMQRFRSDITAVLDRMEPQDCVQLMHQKTQDRRVK